MLDKIATGYEELAKSKMLAGRYGYADGSDICKLTEQELKRRLLDGCEPKGAIWDWQESVILDDTDLGILRAEAEAEAKEQDEYECELRRTYNDGVL